MIHGLISLFLPSYTTTLVYMLQSTEYQVKPYLSWYWRTKDFTTVMQRRTLDRTRAAKLLIAALRLGILLQIVLGLILIYAGLWHDVVGAASFGLAVIVAYPVTWAHLVVVPLQLGRWLVSGPSEQRAIKQSRQIFADFDGVKIAVAGSYGKTTMKELLNTVLSEGKKVAITPANKNVSASHAKFAQNLEGDEDILVIEYGEGAPGDVARFADITKPTHAIITGLAPAHLDQYKTLQAAGEDIFAVADYLGGKNVYVNDESASIEPFIKKPYHVFNGSGALGYKTSNIKVDLDGTSFTLSKGKRSLKLRTALVGRHQVGYLALVTALAIELGLSDKQVISGVAKTRPFEHRMQPYQLSGASIIDDTYNGNLEGIHAGTGLLSELKAKRKLYITPGLVDQGEETEAVHKQVGKLIADAKPDIVVLMKNSVTNYIKQGLTDGGFKGELQIESNPLEFYTNLSHFVAAGDLVVMQNDWTDNYA